MIQNRPETSVTEQPFEPSELIEYGDVDELTRGAASSSRVGDGNYTS
jgi:hypothetical protein